MKRHIIVTAMIGFTASVSAEPTPGFGTIDRFDGQTKATASMGYVVSDGFLGYTNIIRTDLTGQLVAPEGYGGYLSLPLHYVSNSNGSKSGIGNLEIGGLYVWSGPVQLVIRGGISLDTGEDEAIVGILGRLNELPSGPSGWTHFRASISPLYQRGNAFFRADFGIDRGISDNNNDDFEQILRLNLGAGVRSGDLAFMGELVNFVNKDDSDKEVFSLLGATIRWLGSGEIQPHLSLQIPLDEELGEVMTANVILGLEYVP